MKYSIEIHEHGLIVHDPIPLDHFQYIAQMAQDRGFDLMDTGISSAIGATFVGVSEESGKKWREEINEAAEARWPDDPLRAWRDGTDIGVSACTIAFALGSTPLLNGHRGIPYDAADFGRCLRLCDRMGWGADDLESVRKVEADWGAIVDCWDELVEAYRGGAVKEVTNKLRELRGAR